MTKIQFSLEHTPYLKRFESLFWYEHTIFAAVLDLILCHSNIYALIENITFSITKSYEYFFSK